MGKIKCEVVRDLMPLVIDDVASEESKQLVHAHMADCEGCKGYYAGMTVGISRNTTVPDSDKTFIRLGKRHRRVRSQSNHQWNRHTARQVYERLR